MCCCSCYSISLYPTLHVFNFFFSDITQPKLFRLMQKHFTHLVAMVYKESSSEKDNFSPLCLVLNTCTSSKIKGLVLCMCYYYISSVLTQVPPSLWPSITAVFAPSSAALRAPARPPDPPPITRKSKRLLSAVSRAATEAMVRWRSGTE